MKANDERITAWHRIGHTVAVFLGIIFAYFAGVFSGGQFRFLVVLGVVGCFLWSLRSSAK